MKVGLSSSFNPPKKPGSQLAGAPLLKKTGPKVVLSWSKDDQFNTQPIAPSTCSMFGPRGVCLHHNGSLWVADTGHHRLLGWHKVPQIDNQPADIVIGQKDFYTEGRNGGVPIHASSLNVPTGVCTWKNGLAIADAWNHRVLIWNQTPKNSQQPADIIIGQKDKLSNESNQGNNQPNNQSMHWPYGVAEINGHLVVCDTGNRRLLVWKNPQITGQAADLVLGQNDFNCRDENAGDEVSAMSMRWPHQASGIYQSGIALTDAGNNRIMIWSKWPVTNGQDADIILGQDNSNKCNHNQSSYFPLASSVNMPYASACDGEKLMIGDTANSRLLAWPVEDIVNGGVAAKYLSAQPDFSSKGDNRWSAAVRDSLCWPYGLSIHNRLVAIADSGNNRVLLWELEK